MNQEGGNGLMSTNSNTSNSSSKEPQGAPARQTRGGLEETKGGQMSNSTKPLTRQWRKKPVIIEALQFTAVGVIDWEAIYEFCPAARPRNGELYIKTLEGVMHVSPNDFIVKGVNGEFYPVKQDIFMETYEPVSGLVATDKDTGND